MRRLLTVQLAMLAVSGSALPALALVPHLPSYDHGFVIEVQDSTDPGGGESPGGESPGGESPGGESPGGESPGGESGGGVGQYGNEAERMDNGPPVYGSYQNVTVYGLQIQSAVDDCVEDFAAAPSEEGRFLACVGDALDVFAERLASDQVALPESGAEIPQIIRRAAAAVRSAPSAEAARRVVQAAASDVAKTIELIRATDSDPGRTLARQSGSIVESLAAVDSGLARATGI
jgi:hypothetical protein